MTLRTRISLIALVASLPAPALAQSVQDFQLPTAPTPSATPRVQGPVDESAPVPVRPQPIRTAAPTPQPTATVPTPAPSPSATPRATRTPSVQPTRQPAPTPATRPAAQSQAGPAVPTGAEPSPLPPLDPAPIGPTPPVAAPASTPSAPLPAPTVEPTTGSDFTALWPWLGGLAALLLAAIGAWVWRRRKEALPPPAIEPPLKRADSPTATPVTPVPAGQPLSLRVEAIKLTRSFAFATLDYRLTLINRTAQAMSDVAISADLVSAHGNAPMEQQVALATTELPPRHAIARLSPGQSQQITGQVQLPIGNAQVIRQGQLPLFVPLLRLRVDGAGDQPLARTFVIGQGVPDGGRLQPFRLDDGPRTYSPISQRALDLA